MAIFNVKVSGKKSHQTTKKISSVILDLNIKYLKGRKAFTVVVVEYHDRDNWITGGEFLSDLDKSCFIMSCTISDITTDEDKSIFIAQAFKAFNELLGDLHEYCYISIQQFNKDSFSYNRPFDS
jgi:4-oxalocrotonate tautomerase